MTRSLFCCRRGLLLVTVLAGVCVSVAAAVRQSAAVSMRQSAVALLETLNESQQEQIQRAYDDPQRVAWHFVPMQERKGLALREMDDAQRTAALRLLRAAMSEAGYGKASQIMLMERVLQTLEGPNRTWDRDWQKYYVTLFGSPDQTDSPWGLSFEGHHLSLNFVCRGDEVVDSSPQFFGANPAELRVQVEGAPLDRGTRILADEEKIAFELVAALSDGQRQKAIIAEEAPSEIRAAGEAQPPQAPPAGIAYRELTESQIELLKRLVNVYAGAMPEEVAQGRVAAIEQAGWEAVHFAWAGATEPGIGHYYRIQGPTFLIEFNNTQPDAEGNPANHIHCVWRDMTGDFNLAAN